jgi:hypothetical protein
MVLLDPAGCVKKAEQPGAPVTEPFFLHMVFMWAMWQCFFQAPLELFFGFGFAGYGRQRTAYLFAETIFEVGLLVECAYLKYQGLPYYEGDVNLIISVVTVALFVPVLLFGRDKLDTYSKPVGTEELRTPLEQQHRQILALA